jgi:hypothetical protein
VDHERPAVLFGLSAALGDCFGQFYLALYLVEGFGGVAKARGGALASWARSP